MSRTIRDLLLDDGSAVDEIEEWSLFDSRDLSGRYEVTEDEDEDEDGEAYCD